MDERKAGQGQSSRRAALRALPTPTDLEVYAADAPPLLEVIGDLPEPRIAELDALLREVDSLRSTMRRDLTLAATAADAGADDLAGWLLLGEGGKVRAFEERALAHLSGLDASKTAAAPQPEPEPIVVPAARRTRRMMPAAPLVAAAAAIVGFLTGVVPGTGGSQLASPRTSNAAMESYADLAQLASDGASPSRLTAAAQKFHAALAPLVTSAGADPAATRKAIALLQSERAVIAGEADSPALRAVLAQADALVLKLRATLPRAPRPLAPLPQPKSSSTTKSSPSPAAKASPSPSPSASPKASPSPSPSASPKPSASGSSSPGPLPPGPGALPG